MRRDKFIIGGGLPKIEVEQVDGEDTRFPLGGNPDEPVVFGGRPNEGRADGGSFAQMYRQFFERQTQRRMNTLVQFHEGEARRVQEERAQFQQYVDFARGMTGNGGTQ